MNDRYAVARKQGVYLGCLGRGKPTKDCKVKACCFNGCTKKHNHLLHSKSQMDDGNHSFNVSAAKINLSYEVMSFRQIVPA